MKTKQHSTYQLLSTLDGNEQQYISKRLTSPVLSKLYHKQLGHIAQGDQAQAAEGLLLADSNTNALRVAQHKLYHEVLRLLVQYQTSQKPEFDGYAELLKTDVLRSKNLLHAYELALNKQLAQAKQQGNLSLAYELVMRMLHLAGMFLQEDTPKLVEQYSQQLQELAEVQSVIAQLKATYYNLVKLLSHNRYLLHQGNEQGIAAYEQKLPLALPHLHQYFEVAFYYYSIKLLCCALQFNHEELQGNMDQLQTQITKHHSNMHHIAEYVLIQHVYINSRFALRDFDSVKKCLQEIAALKSKDPVMQATQWGILQCNRIRYEATTLQYDGLKKTFKYIKQHHEQHTPYFSTELKTTLYCNSLIAAFILEQYADCAYFQALCLQMGKKVMRKDAYSFIRVFILFIYISEQDTDALEKHYRKLKREMATDVKPFKFDAAALDFVQTIIKGGSLRKSVQLLSDRLVPLLAHPYESLPLRYFNFVAWCKSVERGISYRNYNLMKSG